MSSLQEVRTVRQFPIRLIPGPNEGPGIFEMREIEENRLTQHQYRKLGGGYGERCIRPVSTPAVSEVVAAVRAIEANRREHGKCWITTRSRVCPLCVADQDFTRSVGWEIRLADACVVHGCWLVDTCACGAPLPRNRSSVRVCDLCGCSLGLVKTSAAPDAVVEISRALCHLVAGGNLMDSGVSLPDGATISLAAMQFHELHLMYRMLGISGDPHSSRGLLRSLAQLEPMEYSWNASTLAAEVIFRWPSAFHDLVDWNRRHHDDGSPYGLQRTLGHLYRDIFQYLRGDVFDFVRQELQTYLALHWRGSIVRSSRFDHLPFLKRRWVSASDAARALSLSPATLQDHINRGNLLADCRKTQAGRNRIVVDQASIDEFIKEQLANTCTLDQAAKRLGLKRSRLARVLKQLLPSAWHASDRQWHIKIAEVDALASLTDSLTPLERLESDEMTVEAAMRYHRLSDAAFIALIGAGQKGDGQKPIGRDTGTQGLPSWVFKRSEIEAIQSVGGTPTERIGLSLPQLAEHLGFKQEVIYFLCRVGAINSIPSATPGYRGAIVRWADIENFRKGFIAARDVAREVGSSPRAVVVALGRQGVEPIYGPATGCRQAFYRRDAQLSVLLERLWGQWRPSGAAKVLETS